MNPVLMGVLLFITIAFFSLSMFRRILPLLVMQPDIRWDKPGSRIVTMIKYAVGQLRFFRRFELWHGLAHVLIFWGFLAVSINTIHLVGRGFVPNWSIPGLHGTTPGLAYAFIKDLFVLAVMIGTLGALFRRVILKPERMTLSWEANLILVWIFVMMVLDVLYSSTLFILFPDNPEQKTAFMGVIGMNIMKGFGLGNASETTLFLHSMGLWGHVALVFAFLNYLPYGKHFHVILSLPGVFAGNPEKNGELEKQDLESDDAIFGVSKLDEFSWKRAMDMYNCTECGRCQANCPAHLTEKPLSPKFLIMDERDHLKKNTSVMLQAAWNKLGKKTDKCLEILENTDILTGEVIKDDVLWSCTTCGHCVENCPVLIEHIPNIVDMRRYLVQMESRFPKELTAVFKGWENMSNPWSLASNSRGDWFEDLGVKLPAENPDFEYLYYVGCAGSFEDRNKKVSTSLVRLMQKGNVNFACMGNDEMCCGETARRLGNEYLAQTMIQTNIELWNELGVKKIVTSCPHCYNTLKNEYHQFGGNYEVISHTELIKTLIGEGRIKPELNMDHEGAVVYHDSCYLGRYNKIYDIPREIACSVPGTKLVETERKKNTSFCCGAGGGRMWMEENIGSRINSMRCDQLLETDAKTFATACPFCLIMLDDAIKEKNLEDEIKILDLAEMVDRSVKD
ncbi:MAG: 4Fe-4S dicluster domain-containing protein [Desulfobacterales bacterium]|jgi:Fe-S oxidoreductase|nr:4Fe-4S dicluster domain-containing protein [Desulfobacteraceae bacterium]MBT7086644.1 4Fe-4S dicluster domain-containing protein [Desulfobacterales bacterium]MBT7696844.1 4Fe-4S dicluster domain-containing protein [Desulfobacterales bacterium]